MTVNFNDYNTGAGIIPDNHFKISPSQFYKFFDKPHEWFRSEFLKEKTFTGNTGSELGTIIHKAAECFFQGHDLTNEEIEAHIDTLPMNDDIDPSIIKQSYRHMIDSLLEYLMTIQHHSLEEYIHTPMSDLVTAAGSYDLIRTDSNGKLILVDYKTTSLKNPPKYIEYKHKLQALIYAYILKQQGTNINTIEIVYITRPHEGAISPKTGKQLKSYPATTTPLQYTLTQDDFNFIESLLKLCTETMEHFFDHPQTAYLLFKDYRFKNQPFDVSKYSQDDSLADLPF